LESKIHRTRLNLGLRFFAEELALRDEAARIAPARSIEMPSFLAILA